VSSYNILAFRHIAFHKDSNFISKKERNEGNVWQQPETELNYK